LKDYYQILRVRRGASAAEIRRAYRVLVQQLHPDVNPDPAAHELIKEVNEAYDVLGDAVKKQAYDYSLDNPYTTVSVPQEPVHRDRAYRRRGTYRPPASQGPTQRDMMQRYVHYTTKIGWIGCVLCFILAIDFGIPHRVTEDTVRTFQSRGSGRSEANYVVTYSGQYLKINARDWTFFEVDQPIEVITSRLFSILVEIRIPESNMGITNLGTVYGNFIFALVLLGVFSVLSLVIKGNVEFKFNLGIVNMFVLIFTIILLLK